MLGQFDDHLPSYFFLDTKSYPYWFGTTIVVDIFFFFSFLFLFSFSSFSGCGLESTSVALTSGASSVKEVR